MGEKKETELTNTEISVIEVTEEYLLHFDEIYRECTDAEKKKFMQSFVDRIELYPERRKDGNWIKNILFNFSIPVVREDEELARIGGISLENSTLSNVELPLEKLSTHERVVFLCERDQNLQFVNIKNPRIHRHYSLV